MQSSLHFISRAAPAGVDPVVMKVRMVALPLVSAVQDQVNWTTAGFETMCVLNCLGRWKWSGTSAATSNYPE